MAAAVELDHEGQRAVGVIVLGVVEGEIGVLVGFDFWPIQQELKSVLAETWKVISVIRSMPRKSLLLS